MKLLEKDTLSMREQEFAELLFAKAKQDEFILKK